MGVMNLNGRMMQILAIKLLKTIICDSNSFIIHNQTSNTTPPHQTLIQTIDAVFGTEHPMSSPTPTRLFTMLVLAVTVGDPTGKASGIGPGCHPTY